MDNLLHTNSTKEVISRGHSNVKLSHAYDLIYSIYHVAWNVNNYFDLTCIKLPWENVNIRNVDNDQYPVGTRESNTGLYKDNKW